MYEDRRVTAVIVAAGSARRMDGIDKQFAELAGMSVLARSVLAFENDPFVDSIIIVVRRGTENKCRREIVEKYSFKRVVAVISGGAERHDSVRAALAVAPRNGIILIHDGARPLVSRRIIDSVIENCAARGTAVPALPVKDTIKQTSRSGRTSVVTSTLNRSSLRAAQTPQGFDVDLLRKAYRMCGPDTIVTDDASIVEASGEPVYIIDGDEINIKITTPRDLERAELFLTEYRAYQPADDDTDAVEVAIANAPHTGIGYDVHAFAKGRKLVLGGVTIPHDRGLLGHSDADVLIHAIIDALLGAAALGDIGKHFPDTDPNYQDISSLLLLGYVGELLRLQDLIIINIDATVIAQQPKIARHIPKMKKNIAKVLKISESQINIKGTTTEGLGFTGREEGIASQAIASIIRL